MPRVDPEGNKKAGGCIYVHYSVAWAYHYLAHIYIAFLGACSQETMYLVCKNCERVSHCMSYMLRLLYYWSKKLYSASLRGGGGGGNDNTLCPKWVCVRVPILERCIPA